MAEEKDTQKPSREAVDPASAGSAIDCAIVLGLAGFSWAEQEPAMRNLKTLVHATACESHIIVRCMY